MEPNTPAIDDALEYVIEAFTAVQTSLQKLCKAITDTDAHLPAWSETCGPQGPLNTHELLETRTLLAKHLSNLWHHRHDEHKRIPGLIACSEHTLALLQTLNEQKARLEHRVVGLRKTFKAPTATLAQLLSLATGKSTEEVAFALNTADMNNINLSFCYRKVQQLPHSIQSVSWTWSRHSRSIKSLTVLQSTELANDTLSGKATQQSALDQLERLPLDTPLAIVRPVQTALKANITFSDTESRTVRKLITAHSPLLMLDTGDALPRKHWPGYPQENDSPDTPNTPRRLSRQQRYLEHTPYIRALNLYRYLENEPDTQAPK